MMPPRGRDVAGLDDVDGGYVGLVHREVGHSRTLLPTDIAMNGSSASAAHVTCDALASGWCSDSTATNRSRSRTSDCNDGASGG